MIEILQGLIGLFAALTMLGIALLSVGIARKKKGKSYKAMQIIGSVLTLVCLIVALIGFISNLKI